MKNDAINFSLENLKRIAASNLTKTESFSDVIEYFKILWCHHYKRPFKDPLLKEYTSYELILEVVTFQFLDSPKSLDDFIRKDNGEIDAIMEDDELWFKEKMADGYTDETYRTEEYKRQVEAAKKKTGENIEELPDGDYSF